MTNFAINTDEQVIYAPFKSRTKAHADWINDESGFPGKVRPFTINIHANGDNILGYDEMHKVFDVLDEVRNTPGYHQVCAEGDYVNFDDVTTCKIMSFTRFFKHDVARMEYVYDQEGEEGVIDAISADAYENLTPVDTDAILGLVERDEESGLITSVQSYKIFVLMPITDEVKEMEQRILDGMFLLKGEWDADANNSLELEFFAMKSYSDEFARAIENDLFLLPVVFLLMSGFTCLVFFRCDRVQSRASLGVGSVVTIVLALMSSFGIMFTIGVPFTSMTQILPFVIFGVGLDDTFIITGAYFRTDPKKDPVDRIRETMEEVGLSISVTTITTMFAFILGCISTIPAIYWLNLYAFPTIVIDFLFQITFFVALIVLDERRVQANRMDCCICARITSKVEDWDENATPVEEERIKSAQERFMGWYARQLLRPRMKAIVLVLFLGYFSFCGYTTSLLTQEFDFSDLLPANSYVKDFLYSMDAYGTRILGIGIYFRGDFDQMDPDIMDQMKNYVDELSALPQLAAEPPFCWFRDFEEFQNSSLAESAGMGNMTLQEQIDYAFTVDAIKETYGKHVVRDENGRITASRCYTYLEDIDLGVVKEQIKFLQDQRAITARQPINQGTDEWSFFTFDNLYFIWVSFFPCCDIYYISLSSRYKLTENTFQPSFCTYFQEFYAIAVEELIFTTISGVVAVCTIGFFFFPHWKAILFIFPLMCMLYINLLGTLQWAGMYINAVTYICLVISIGLMVDFIVHVLLRYYESKEKSREAKVIDTLETMGASILVGGLSTSLGVLPMALSTSKIMGTVFVSFFAMISIGVLHGLVFLPVVLSICGPVSHTAHDLLEGTGDLALKVRGDSDTDDSSDEEDEAVRKSLNATLSKHGSTRELSTRSSLRAPSREEGGTQHLSEEVLHSQTTFREESLEVVQWQSTMAWI